MAGLIVVSVAVVIAIVSACSTSTTRPDKLLSETPAPAIPLAAEAGAVTVAVLGHHNDAKRSGTYIQPGLTRAAAATLHRDLSFDGAFSGHVHAQPLFVPEPRGGTGMFYVVTESNDVLAFDGGSGHIAWSKNFGPPADNMNADCVASFSPIGITGTPAIDSVTRTLYVDSLLSMGYPGNRVAAAHLIHALSLDDGSERAGWPVDPTGLESNGHYFDPTVQHQRGALSLVGGMLYVPYGSLGDCGGYHGWIVAIPVADPSKRSAYCTPGMASGMWAPNGIAADEGAIFVATGNSADPEGAWAGGEAVLRFPAGVPLTDTPVDFFAPANWHDLDDRDADLGASGVLLLDMPASSPAELALALGKDGFAYLLDQNHLGGLADGGAEGVAKLRIATRDIATAPAAFTTSKGTFVAIDVQAGGVGVGCPDGQAGDVIVLHVIDGSPPSLEIAWCAQNAGHGSPIVTTTDGSSEPIVWLTSDQSERLHGFDGETGQLLFDGGDDTQQISGVDRFNTLIAVDDRVVVAANNRLYAFGP